MSESSKSLRDQTLCLSQSIGNQSGSEAHCCSLHVSDSRVSEARVTPLAVSAKTVRDQTQSESLPATVGNAKRFNRVKKQPEAMTQSVGAIPTTVAAEALTSSAPTKRALKLLTRTYEKSLASKTLDEASKSQTVVCDQTLTCSTDHTLCEKQTVQQQADREMDREAEQIADHAAEQIADQAADTVDKSSNVATVETYISATVSEKSQETDIDGIVVPEEREEIVVEPNQSIQEESEKTLVAIVDQECVAEEKNEPTTMDSESEQNDQQSLQENQTDETQETTEQPVVVDSNPADDVDCAENPNDQSGEQEPKAEEETQQEQYSCCNGDGNDNCSVGSPNLDQSNADNQSNSFVEQAAIELSFTPATEHAKCADDDCSSLEEQAAIEQSLTIDNAAASCCSLDDKSQRDTESTAVTADAAADADADANADAAADADAAAAADASEQSNPPPQPPARFFYNKPFAFVAEVDSETPLVYKVVVRNSNSALLHPLTIVGFKNESIDYNEQGEPVKRKLKGLQLKEIVDAPKIVATVNPKDETISITSEKERLHLPGTVHFASSIAQIGGALQFVGAGKHKQWSFKWIVDQ